MQNNANGNPMQDVHIGFLPDEEWNIFLYSAMLANTKGGMFQPRLNTELLYENEEIDSPINFPWEKLTPFQRLILICQPVPKSASLEDYVHIVQSLPDDDPAELLGVYPKAMRSYREIQGQKFTDSLTAMQPRATSANLMIRSMKFVTVGKQPVPPSSQKPRQPADQKSGFLEGFPARYLLRAFFFPQGQEALQIPEPSLFPHPRTTLLTSEETALLGSHQPLLRCHAFSSLGR
ncbi:Dynein Heavy Chain 14, Axonemal [Manis pentadactyla]|nr:Dynein Heavy Chain 14, Axonemal [Manis pentadactyla]